MDFSSAAKILRAGGAVTRAAWSASGLRLEMRDSRIFAVAAGGDNPNGEYWGTNQFDILSEDWAEVARPAVRTFEQLLQEQVLRGNFPVLALAHITMADEVCVTLTVGEKQLSILVDGDVAKPVFTAKPPTQRAAVEGIDGFGAMGAV